MDHWAHHYLYLDPDLDIHLYLHPYLQHHIYIDFLMICHDWMRLVTGSHDCMTFMNGRHVGRSKVPQTWQMVRLSSPHACCRHATSRHVMSECQKLFCLNLDALTVLETARGPRILDPGMRGPRIPGHRMRGPRIHDMSSRNMTCHQEVEIEVELQRDGDRGEDGDRDRGRGRDGDGARSILYLDVLMTCHDSRKHCLGRDLP